MAKPIIILFTFLLLACNEKAQAELPKLQAEPQKLGCSPYSSSTRCDDEMIKDWYQKKYGEPITEFELLTKKIDFTFEKKNIELYSISIRRTESVFVPLNTNVAYIIIKEKHSLEEWFDFIRALRKCSIYEWKKIYGTTKKGYAIEWKLTIYQKDEKKDEKEGPNYKFIEHRGFDAYPENWKEFEKIIDDIKTRIEKTGEHDKYIYGP